MRYSILCSGGGVEVAGIFDEEGRLVDMVVVRTARCRGVERRRVSRSSRAEPQGPCNASGRGTHRALDCRFFADILLTPLEATRIRLVSQRGYATGLTTGFARLAREEGVAGLYAGFLPILCKYVRHARLASTHACV
ncbi:hypothetical protein BD309DRAFT_975288 [Dichomitus squalens]|nr:hypothetical protein BD309DRAFT_975288 [Dichomitus squalens]